MTAIFWCPREDSNLRQTHLRRVVLYPAELLRHICFIGADFSTKCIEMQYIAGNVKLEQCTDLVTLFCFDNFSKALKCR